MKLTKAQTRVLASVSEGAVLMHFDVWQGYWWTERNKRMVSAFGYPPKPIAALVDLRFIAQGPAKSIASGYRQSQYIVTDAGRRALAEQEGTE